FLPQMNALGVTTVECKSGYGLNKESELKLLAVYDELTETGPTRILSTFLGAHMVPNEYREKREEYISLLTEELIPEVAKKNLASFCDIFVEESAFSLEEARMILGVAKQHGLTPKLHVDQLTPGKGAELAADMRAASADHLEHISEEGIKRLAQEGVVAVSLPLASLYTNEPYLNARPLLEAGVDVAVATDFNPGSAPSYDLPLALLLSCNGNRLTPHEALKGATIIAAKALQIDGTTGSLEPGKSADFAILDTPSINHWLYHFQPNCCLATVSQGELLYGSLS
ncbi:MAG: amidohydrolase family protein, partial [Bdellovibrionales bacterium]|nr:amidohydrolase family protein [Bdellovibrionales bacterium]